jgi:hypothetical protein
VTREHGTRQIGFYLSNQGRYPLYELRVYVGKPYRVSASDSTIQTFGTSRQFQELNGNASYPLWFTAIPEEDSTLYSASTSARNGTWEEVINVRRVSSGIASHWILFRSNDPRISSNEQVVDLADESFPSGERKQKIYPLNARTLPVVPRP